MKYTILDKLTALREKLSARKAGTRLLALLLALVLLQGDFMLSAYSAGEDSGETATESTTNDNTPTPLADDDTSSQDSTDTDTTLYTIIIEYVYAADSQFAGQLVAQAHIEQYAAGVTPSNPVTSPTCVGYTPDQATVDLPALGPINENKTITVYYSPAEVSYTVRHYQQNIYDDEHTWVDTTLVKGKTEAQTSDDAAKKYTGFHALPHYPEPIAADSSTMIDIYYDRDYHLISFDLDGGHGVDPIYARYGTPISVGTPSKTGWVFNGWRDKDGNAVTIPKTMPNANTTYYANWSPSPAGTEYSVVYWVNNSDGTKTYLDSKVVAAQAGKQVYGVDDICGTEVHAHTDSCSLTCGNETHSHTTDCFSSSKIVIGNEFTSGEDMKAILAANSGIADKEGTYLYFIQASWDVGIRYWPKLSVDGKYYNITVSGGYDNGSISESVLQNIVSGEKISQGTSTYTAYKYAVNPSYISCGKTEHYHDDACFACGKAEHTHTAACEPDIVRHLLYVGSDSDSQTITVAGDGSTVLNVYYEYKTYTIRYVYARKNTDGDYQIATNTHEGGFDDCEWTDVGTADTVLPTFTDPSGKTERSSFVRAEDGFTYYYISLTAEFGADIADKWPAANIGDVGAYRFGSWASAPGTPYRKLSTLNANVVGSYPTMSADMIVDNPELLADDSYLAQNMIAWWGASDTIGAHAYHNFFEVLSAPSGEVGTTPTVIDGETYVMYGGKIYKLENLVFNVAHNGTTRVDPLEYIGYTVINDDPTKQENSLNYANNGSCTICGTTCQYCNTFYYDRAVHTLKFWNHNTWLSGGNGTEVPYSASLAIYEAGTDSSLGATTLAQNNYPTGLETGVYEFVGWYTTAECHENSAVNWETATMPDSDLTLYAKWDLITYNVSVYRTEEDVATQTNQIGTTVAVTHNEFIPEESRLDDPTDSNATFIGWFYRDEKNVEQAFSFASTPITQAVNIYAKWRSNLMKQVEIYYVVKNTDGTQTQIADTETLMLRVGQTRTFDAKIGNSLYVDYRTGCFPTTASHSITPTAEDVEKAEPITYTFVYKEYSTVPYQVEFYVLEKDGTKRPAFMVTGGKATFISSETYASWSDDKKQAFNNSNSSLSSGAALTEGGKYIELHWQNDKAIVTELYVPENLADATWTLPDEYLPNALRLQKVIVPSEDDPEGNIEANTIEFIYTYTEAIDDPDSEDPNDKVYESKYLVQHYIQSVKYLEATDKTGLEEYELYTFSNGEGYSTKTATASPISIPGYTYSYDVTNTKKQAGTTLTKSPDTMSGTITADDKLELNFYYTVNQYPYQIMYLEKGTNRVLMSTTTTATNGDLLKANYGARATYTLGTDAENALLEDYEVDATSKSIYIQMEADNTTASINTIIFYYTRKSADLIISKTVKLDEEQAKEEGIDKLPDSALTQEFVFTVTYPQGFYKSVYDCIITDKDGNTTNTAVIAGTTSLSVKLKHGDTIRIQELDMGTYTITETYVPGFRITVNNGTDAQQKEDVTVTAELISANQDVTVDFVNSYPFFTGELVLGKTVKKLDEANDPSATGPYQVTVTLAPADETREVDRTITWTDADGTAKTFAIPALTGTDIDVREFSFDVLVPVDDTVTLSGVPAGNFTAEETTIGNIGYITDYYKVWYDKDLHKNETTESAAGATVTGVIHGGHPTSVTFTNTYKKGSLTINKTVTQKYANDNWQSDTFTFQITGKTELPDGGYIITVGGTEETAVVASGTLTLTGSISVEKPENTTNSSWSNSLTFENLPAGYYTVTETSSTKGLDKYDVPSPVADLLVNDTDTATVAQFTNTYNRTTGNLQVSKAIKIVGEGYNIDEAQEFTFTISLTDGVLDGTYNCTVKDANGSIVQNSPTSLTVQDGKLSFTLQHDHYILIKELPVGVYEVSETQVEGYASYFGSATSASETANVTVQTSTITELNCTNKYPVNFGTLIVSKTVNTPDGYSKIDVAPTDDMFTFTIQISDYSTLFDLEAFVTAQFSPSESEQVLTITDDTLSFYLKANQSVELMLPVCNYTITETGLNSTVNSGELSNHYTTTIHKDGNINSGTSMSSKIISGGTETVEFTNTYKRHYADLVITQKGMSQSDSGIYQVTDSKGDTIATVAIIGNSSATIKDLPVGNYTVTELTSWIYEYSTLSPSIPVEVTSNSTAIFTNNHHSSNWLDGECYKDNDFN